MERRGGRRDEEAVGCEGGGKREGGSKGGKFVAGSRIRTAMAGDAKT